MSTIKKLIIHCSATPNGRATTAEDILNWHTKPKPEGFGWKHAGYHFVIELDGQVKPLVPLNDDSVIEGWEIANGAYGHNHEAIHVCLIGTDQFTQAQWDALNRLNYDTVLKHPDITIHGHNEFAPHKSCPGFNVPLWMAEPRRIEATHLLVVQS